MRWVDRDSKLPAWAFLLTCAVVVLLVEELRCSSWAKFLILMAAASLADFLERHRFTTGEARGEAATIRSKRERSVCPKCGASLPVSRRANGMSLQCLVCAASLRVRFKSYWLYLVTCAVGAIATTIAIDPGGPFFPFSSATE